MKGIFCLAIITILVYSAVVQAADTSDFAHLSLEISFNEGNSTPSQFKGKLELSHLKIGPEKKICFYLPYQDPEYGSNRGDMHRFEMLTSSHRKPSFSRGFLKLDSIKNASMGLTPWKHIVSLTLPDGWDETSSLLIDFNAQVPRLDRSRDQEWVFDGFFPQLMKQCPDPAVSKPEVSRPYAIVYDVNIRPPIGWQYLGLGSHKSPNIQFKGLMTSPSFMLVRGLKASSFKYGLKTIHFAYQSESFLELIDTLTSSLKSMEDIFGNYPFESLTVVESTELQRHGTPGLIAINRPPQLIFDKVQKDLLNWQHWILVLQVSKQWAGATAFSHSSSDDWLMAGISEYATLEALKNIPKRFDIFNSAFWREKILSLTYLQQSEILTSILKKTRPYAILTRDDAKTLDAHEDQDKLLFFRHTAAMRQIQTIVGKAKFHGYLRKTFADYAFKGITPKEFISHIDNLPSPFSLDQRTEISNYLMAWWTLNGWPDFQISNVTSREIAPNQFRIDVTIDQIGGMDHPPVVAIMGTNGKLYELLGKKSKHSSSWEAQFLINTSIDWIEVDPRRLAFDSDRFNNSTRMPNFYFFPGSARTIADNAYTFLWLPYPLRRPGEDISLGIQGGIFKYVHGALTTNIEISPSNKKHAYALNYNYQWAHQSLINGFSIKKMQDNNREMEVNITDGNITRTSSPISLGILLKRKDFVGQASSVHGAFGFTSSFRQPSEERMCNFALSATYEHAPSKWSTGFSYERSLGTLLGECRVTHQIGYSAKAFLGSVTGFGLLPQSALFKPNELSEARLRIDSGMERVTRIQSITNDLSFPLYFPLPFDFLILSRQLRWRLFYDIGRAPRENVDYRSTGLGFQLPIGGDLSGAGSLAFTKLSLLAVLHSQIGDQEIKKPSILFDFTGQL